MYLYRHFLQSQNLLFKEWMLPLILMVEKALVLQNREGGGRINSFWKYLPTCFSTQSFYILKLKTIKSVENKKDQSYRQWRRGVIFTIKIWTFKTLMWCKICEIPPTNS